MGKIPHPPISLSFAPVWIHLPMLKYLDLKFASQPVPPKHQFCFCPRTHTISQIILLKISCWEKYLNTSLAELSDTAPTKTMHLLFLWIQYSGIMQSALTALGWRPTAGCQWPARHKISKGRARRNWPQVELDAGCPTLNTSILTTELWGLGKAHLLVNKLFSF